MPLNKTDLSFKKLINKEFTHVSRSFFQEVTAATLDINSTEVYTTVIANTTGSAITNGYARQLTQFVLTPDPTYATQAWYVCSGSGFTPGVTSYDSTKVQRNFISDKYGSEFEIKLYDNGGSQIFKTDAINWYFDYKTGILHVADPGAYSTPYKATIIQYIGTTLSGSLASLSGSISGFATNAISSGSTSLTTYANGNIIASGSLIVSGNVTASFFSGNGSGLTNIVSSSYALTASYVQNAVSASNSLTASYVQSAVSSSYSLTSSYVLQAVSASYVLQAVSASQAITASYVQNAISASYINTSSYSLTTRASGSNYNIQLSKNGLLSSTDNFKYDDVNDILLITGSLILGTNNHISSSFWSYIEGTSNSSSGVYNHLEGSVNFVNGLANHAEGTFNKILGNYNHIKGANNIITGSRNNVGGANNIVLDIINPSGGASQLYTHIEGQYNTGSAIFAHNEGQNTETYGNFSHAEGLGTIASGSYQHVQGQYNIADQTSLFIIGNGTDSANRSNLMSGIGSIVSITGSLKVSGSITGSLQGTASYATTAISASYFSGSISSAVSSSYALTASYVQSAVSSSYAVSASYVFNAISASYATTALSASYVPSVSNISPAITNNVNNYVLTATGNGQINGESNLLFDGTNLNLTGNLISTGNISATENLIANTKLLVNSGEIETLSTSASLFSSASYLNLGINSTTVNIGRSGIVTVGGDLKLDTNVIKSSNGSTSLTLFGSNATFANDLNINGNLTVLGDTITMNTANILVEDKFILLASGSTSINDGGIIVQNSVSGTGYALYFDSTGDGTSARWSLSENVSSSAVAVTPSYFIASVTGSTSIPSSAPTYGYGTMHIVTGNGDIYIYS